MQTSESTPECKHGVRRGYDCGLCDLGNGFETDTPEQAREPERYKHAGKGGVWTQYGPCVCNVCQRERGEPSIPTLQPSAPALQGEEREDDESVRCTCEWAHPVDGEVDPLAPAVLDPRCRVHGASADWPVERLLALRAAARPAQSGRWCACGDELRPGDGDRCWICDSTHETSAPATPQEGAERERVAEGLRAACAAGADSLRTSAKMAGTRGWPVAVREAEAHARTLDTAADRILRLLRPGAGEP